ncbi:hypothetical protein LSH36_181g04036 [Paralvinella palmiformis]|uniref:Spermidine synthase n=1 Tax=Paralvinella palmiformis TaxID=53620 RepID=A0AAD9JRQ3_9ANNE|nr:hypothetical protein LSH36_181g04036 [Paralvinella palmiformis]
MDALQNGWFSELNDLWPGQCMSLKVTKVLHEERSKYQDIKVLETNNHGRALVLDGVIQLTESDEFSYQEMLAHVPVNSHPNPENVLVIGGGDGGVVRELTKNPAVKKITQCEIDDRVIEISKEYLPTLSEGFQSPKLTLHLGDGFKFMMEHEGEFDVIITDSSDPVGPAMSLFEKSYYERMKKALKPDGIICSQGECLWLHLNLIKEMQDFCKELFPVVDYCYCSVPTYPSGQIGFILCSLNPETNFNEPIRIFSDKELEDLSFKYL